MGEGAEEGPRALRWLLPSPGAALWLATFLVCVASPFTSRLISADGDFALHVVHGRLILAAGGLLEVEPTALFSGDRPFLAHEWLAQLGFGLADRACELVGPVLLVGLLLASILTLCWRQVRDEGVDPWPALAVLVGVVLLARLHMLARPHLATWLLAMLWCAWLERLQREELSWRAWLGRALALMVLWVNLHGGFLAGFYILGLFGLGALARLLNAAPPQRPAAARRFAGLVGAGLLLLAASGLNPSGFVLHLHLIDVMSWPELAFVREFRSPDFHRPEQRLALLVILAFLAVLASSPRRPQAGEWIRAWGLALIAFISARHAPLFALLSAPLVGRHLQAHLDACREGDSWLSAAARGLQRSSARLRALETRLGGLPAVATLALLTAVAVARLDPSPVRFHPETLPVEALRHVRAQREAFAGVSFAPYRWGGYVVHQLYPAHRTLVHGFGDHFGRAAMRRFAQLRQAAPGWQALLDERQVAWILADAQGPVDRAALADPGWREVYRDELAALFLRE